MHSNRVFFEDQDFFFFFLFPCDFMFRVSCNRRIYHAEIWPLVTFELNPKIILKSILIFLNTPPLIYPLLAFNSPPIQLDFRPQKPKLSLIHPQILPCLCPQTPPPPLLPQFCTPQTLPVFSPKFIMGPVFFLLGVGLGGVFFCFSSLFPMCSQHVLIIWQWDSPSSQVVL